MIRIVNGSSYFRNLPGESPFTRWRQAYFQMMFPLSVEESSPREICGSSNYIPSFSDLIALEELCIQTYVVLPSPVLLPYLDPSSLEIPFFRSIVNIMTPSVDCRLYFSIAIYQSLILSISAPASSE